MSTLNIEAALQSIPAVAGASLQPDAPAATLARTLLRAGMLLFLALAAICIDGYHPFSEDAGIYVAGIKQAAHPDLYGSSAVFVTASSRLSRFSAFNAWLISHHGLSLDLHLFVTQLLTTWLLLFACWRLACLCFRRNETRWISVAATALCLSVPVAGSSLFMLDPYVTARSFTMPLTILAVVACLESRFLRCGLLLVLIALFHPLMSIYAAGFLLLLFAVRQRSSIGAITLTLSAVAAGGVIQFVQRGVVESIAYRTAVSTRTYFFLSQWQWYELIGITAPLALLAAFLSWHRRLTAPAATHSTPTNDDRSHFFATNQAAMLARASLAFGLASIAVSLLFVHPASHSHFIAAMQPMRAFILIYLFMFLLLGGVLGEFWVRRQPWLAAILLLCAAATIAFFQHQGYPASAHLQLPGMVNRNPWNQAFLWIRDHTPADSVVALDADYIHAPEEDAQGFRAIAERGSLADAAKDGGAAAVFPQLADRWMTEHLLQTGLNDIDDAERFRRLAPRHVSWIVLDRSAPTAFDCPFQNARVKVCRLP